MTGSRDVFYAAATRLGSGGVGGIAANAVRALVETERLRAVAAYGKPPAGVPDSLFRSVKRPVRNPLANRKKRRMKERLAFDSATADMIEDGIALFHGWNANCLETLNAARGRGIVTIVERASTHMDYQMRILRDAYAAAGIDPGEIEREEVVRRCVEEYLAADYVLVPSSSVYDSFVEEGFDSSRLVLLPFGVDIERFAPPVERQGPATFLFCGRIGIRKGVHHLLKAWKMAGLQDARLILVGNVDKEFAGEFDRLSAQKGVETLPYSDDMPGLYSKASVFVLPTLEEGSALVTYEAMAAGLPLITNVRAGSVARQGEEAVLVDTGDIAGLANALTEAAENPERMAMMGVKARKRVEDFTWSRYRERIIKIYDSVIAGEKPVSVASGLE